MSVNDFTITDGALNLTQSLGKELQCNTHKNKMICTHWCLSQGTIHFCEPIMSEKQEQYFISLLILNQDYNAFIQNELRMLSFRFEFSLSSLLLIHE